MIGRIPPLLQRSRRSPKVRMGPPGRHKMGQNGTKIGPRRGTLWRRAAPRPGCAPSLGRASWAALAAPQRCVMTHSASAGGPPKCVVMRRCGVPDPPISTPRSRSRADAARARAGAIRAPSAASPSPRRRPADRARRARPRAANTGSKQGSFRSTTAVEEGEAVSSGQRDLAVAISQTSVSETA